MPRLLGIFGSFLVCAALLAWCIATRVGPEALQRGTELYNYRLFLDRVLGPPRHREQPLVVWLGDSTIMGVKRPSYPHLLRPWLRRRGVASQVLAGPAWDPYVYYFLAGRVVERLDPTVVVIVARVPTFRPKATWREFRYNDVSSYLLPSLLPRTFLLPLAASQLSPARLLLAQTLNDEAVERTFYAAEGLRLLYGEAPFWERLGPPRIPSTFDPALAAVLDSHNLEISRRQPGVVMLEAAVRVVTEAGREALVIASPIPYEAMRARPGYDAAALQRRFDMLRATVQDAGGMFLDLHEFLPQNELADFAGHFGPAGALHVSQAVFPSIREALRRAGAWPDSRTPRRARRPG